MKRKSCYARQYSDQMHCHKCGLVWDMNDPDPPSCRSMRGTLDAGKTESRVDSLYPKNNQQLYSQP